MGTISDKLTYLNETKTQLKDMINYGLDTGEKITSETTFRNYVKSLFDAFIKTMTYPDVLYNNLPKVTGEGTSVTLNDTVYAPMRVELSPSALEQGTNPSPDYPQQIHTVSGENTITISNSDNTQSQTYPLSLGNLEYCKIGDYEDLFFKNVVGSTYYDSTLELDKWYLKKNIGKVVLDGSESWIIFNSSSSRVTFRTIINDIEGYTNGNTIPNIISNRFIPNSYNVTWVIGNVSRTIASGGQNFVLFVYEPNTTVEQFKEWLSSNNTEVYYILKTPTTTLLSDTLQTQLEAIWKANSHEGQTNVSQTNADLPFVLSLSAIEDLG